MKKTSKTILFLLLFAVLIGGSYGLYRTLSGHYRPEQPGTSSLSTQGGTSSVKAAPDFKAQDKNGNWVSLSQLRGKPVLINFWATWCGYCKAEMPSFQKMYDAYGDDVHFLMVNMTDGKRETKEKAESYLQAQGFTFPAYFDISQEAYAKYKVYSLPATYFIDGNGTIASVVNGMTNETVLKQKIEALLGR